ncbi:hypothetical protein C4E04_01005 [Microvirga sp. 17 mud 1-3]|nr:hypothetical protein C4E04_01005 [Microvirga sp. 17 mud 1-3]
MPITRLPARPSLDGTLVRAAARNSKTSLGYCASEPGVFHFRILQALDLICFEPAELLPPSVTGHLRHADCANGIGNGLALLDHHIDLA